MPAVLQNGQIEELVDWFGQIEAVQHVAAGEINHANAAAALGVATGLQALLQGQAGELGRAQLGQPHHGAATCEGQPPHEARQGAERLEALLLDPSQLAGAGIEQPKLVLMPAGGVGHGEPSSGDGARGDVHHHTAFLARVAPTGGCVAGAACCGPGDLAVLEGDAIEVAAVFRFEGIDEGRLPHRPEAAARCELRQTTEHRVHKQRCPLGGEHEFVGIHLAGEEAGRRRVKAIGTVMVLAWCEQVVETPEMGAARHPEALTAGEQSHRAVIEPLMNAEGLTVIHAKEDQPVGAVGGEGQGDALLAQPGCKFRVEAGWGLQGHVALKRVNG